MPKNTASRTILCLLFACCYLTGYGQVTANFSANNTSGCGSLQVAFTDLSTSSAGSIVSWNWDLGGVESVAQNPGRIFGTPGTYTICLTVVDSEGNSDTFCAENLITVFELPQPDFSIDPAEGCIPLTVTFTDQSTSVDGAIEEYIWGLGGSSGVIIDDGSQPVLTSTYNLPDAYSVSLTLTDENGCINTITKDSIITAVAPPILDITILDSFSCVPPLAASFVNNNVEPNVTYYWDFGNGLPIYQGANPPSPFYNQPGQYTVTVVAENNLTSCTDSIVLENVLQIGYPISFNFDQEEGCLPLSVNFMDTSPDAASIILWDFGDGNQSSSPNPNHVYTEPGCYTVTLTRTVNGCQLTETSTNCIQVNPLPIGGFLMDVANACELPHTVNFSSIVPNTIEGWAWDFGDGNQSSADDPSHTYDSFGIFPVSLEITDNNGCVAVFYDTVNVIETEAIISTNPVLGCAPLSFQLNESSTSVSPIIDWEWQIANANANDPNNPIITVNGAQPSLSLADTGVYNVTLIITNSLGCQDVSTINSLIRVGIPPEVDFEAIPTVACVGEEIQFNSMVSDYTDSWVWDFGDDENEVAPNPTHSYGSADIYTVSLTVFYNGCPASLILTDYITINYPQADFSINRDCASPYVVNFVDESLEADSIIWDFGLEGDQDTSTTATPTFIYPDTGCYTVVLTAFNDSTGCENSASTEICITDPLANFSLTPTSGCAPLAIEVTDNSIFAVEWNWQAPGAQVSNNGTPNPTINFNNQGLYDDIQLTITDINGCTDTYSYDGTITVNDVTPQFTPLPSGGCLPLDVQFEDNSTSFIGEIIEWEWNIGNGLLLSSVQNPAYTFDTLGTFSTSLTVTNDWGCTGTLTIPDAVNVTLPTADFTSDSLGCTQSLFNFFDNSEGEGLNYLWDFGNGDISTEANPMYQYPDEGTYSVCLEITDIFGCEQTYCESVFINDPVAQFSLDSSFSECPPLLVNFTNLSINSSTFQWDFGDNSGSSILEDPPHVYTVPGVYDVSLIASSTPVCSDTLLIEDLITLEGPLGDFSFDIDTACVPATITFFGTAVDNYDFIWDFGDGQLDTTLNTMTDTIVHTFATAGNYIPNLILVDGNNCQRALQSPDTIRLAELVIDFVASDSLICDNDNLVSFLNLSNSSNIITDLEWRFEGGNPEVSTDFEPAVNYLDPGIFDVTLIIANGFCVDSLVKENLINTGPTPNAVFTTSTTEGCEPLPVQFTDESTVFLGDVNSWNWQFGNQGSSQIENPQFMFTEAGEQLIELIVATNFGCSDTAYTTIVVNPQPEFVLSMSDQDICIGDYTQLNATFEGDTTGLDYQWFAMPELSCLNCTSPLANPVDTTVYTFTAMNTFGCADTASITVNVRPYEIPEITISPDTSICLGEVVQLQVEGGADVYEYQWDTSRPGLSCYDDCFNPVATPLFPTTYVVTVTNEFDCDAEDSTFVNIIDQALSFAGEDRTICRGDTVQLNTFIGVDPVWLNSNSLSCSYCSDPLAFPETTTTYQIQVTTADEGCELLDSVQVIVIQEEDIDAGTDQEICRGEQTELEGLAFGTVNWSPASDLDNPSSLNPVAAPETTTVYTLTASQDLCTLSDSVEVSVVTETDISGNRYTICRGESVEVTVNGFADTFRWRPENTLSDPESGTPIASPITTTSYLVEGTLSTCNLDTAVVEVIVEPLPEAFLPDSYNKLTGVDLPLEIQLPTGGANYTYQWLRTDGLSCVTCFSPILNIDTSGYYNVIITDQATGCEREDSVFVNLLETCVPDLVGVPNIFTPNGDGVNDQLKLITNTIFEIKRFQIYNRWGAVVFSTTDLNEGWDGTYKGQDLPSGTYVYYLEAPCELDGTIFSKKGDITLIR